MRVGYRQGVEENSFCSAKDGRIRTNSQCQGGCGDRRKQRVARQLSRPKAYIPPKGRQREKATRLPVTLSYQGGIAKLTARGERGLFRGHALAKALLREQLQMRPQLLVKRAILLILGERGF